MDFQAWKDIKRWNGLQVIITSKIDGTNAQILITENQIVAGSRTRYLSLDSDNYGFARFVEENKEELREKLGLGTHYGEWYGAGIGSTYGLKEKRLVLFNTNKIFEKGLPNRIDILPILYQGLYTDTIINEVLIDLKSNGSKLVPGWMKPEGIVIFFPQLGHRFKRVFEQEEVMWKGKKTNKVVGGQNEKLDHMLIANEYLQPTRLKKLFTRDEKYLKNMPSSIPDMAKDYLIDLQKETENIDEIKFHSTKKIVFNWIKIILKEDGLL